MELKNKTYEIEKFIMALISWFEQVELRRYKLKNRSVNIIQSEEQKMKIKERLQRNVGNNYLHDIPEGKDRERVEKVFEKIMAIKSTNLMKNINMHFQEAQQSPNEIHLKDSYLFTPYSLALKANAKDRLLKATRKK